MKVEIVSPRYVCTVCGFTYDPYREVLQERAEIEIPFSELPEDWRCVQCGGSKEQFKEI